MTYSVPSVEGQAEVTVGRDETESEWPMWEVFIRQRRGLSHVHVGSLHAPDAETALMSARDVYTRRVEGVSIWVVASSEIVASDPDADLAIIRIKNVDGKRFDIHSIGADGKDARLETSGEDAFEPAWSPDGTTIAFSEAGAILTVEVETGEERTLTDPENNDSSPTWNPRQGGER